MEKVQLYHPFHIIFKIMILYIVFYFTFILEPPYLALILFFKKSVKPCGLHCQDFFENKNGDLAFKVNSRALSVPRPRGICSVCRIKRKSSDLAWNGSLLCFLLPLLNGRQLCCLGCLQLCQNNTVGKIDAGGF